MQTIRELIDRIRWDPVFSRGEFTIAFLDHARNQLVHIPFRELVFDADSHFFFTFYDQGGNAFSIPLHRIKSVYKDGVLIWHREQ